MALCWRDKGVDTFPKGKVSESEHNTTTEFGLVSLLNGISTFVGYLMPKLFS